ncbi:hypothetical protein [Sporomusa acidovorans]|uniref:Spo0E like sporulation regulatory protein n=1 Tax=Sporomusa acidovorans (strain ATCC 49682 / DSM 3132 / Mol) TaxID=1123286 RepID=A0ABZ3J0U6_SPOA4|nr:hypothetical protein [Sporomusa acidovorans]OZC22536.1 hypothetical protein SPACI_13740 [Sporomusa acidovorans DSM 3132]SDE72690.1 hypothetical protein SAMN04488499_10205 [Sporomusa acidovorans]
MDQQLQTIALQVKALRQQLSELMQNSNSADAEIITASSTLDTQLQDYAQTIHEKRTPSMRTF